MNKTPVRAVLFDFGGVIAEEGFYNGLTSLAQEQSLQTDSITSAGMDAAYDSGFVLGRATAADFWTLLRQRTGLEGDDDYLSKLIIEGFRPRQWMIDLVRELHARAYVTGILSDQTNWLYELDEQYHFFVEFDHIFNSYDLGKGKRDPTLFTDIVNKLGLRPIEALFIDDNAGNIQRARERGLHVILYADRRTFITELQAILQEKFV